MATKTVPRVRQRNMTASKASIDGIFIPRKQEDFFYRVYDIVRCIPFGRVTTYGHIAQALGAKSSARLVGYAMNAVDSAHRATDIPAHRVLNRNGELTGKMHFATPTLMRELLEAEGVEFAGDAVNLKKHLWIPPLI
jgi:methylated-DNA-protein-cysteine methyltransferase related protein